MKCGGSSDEPVTRAAVLRGIFILVEEDRARRTPIARKGPGVPDPYEESQREREDYQIAFAGEDYGQESAVGRDIEFANGDASEDWLRRGCEGGDVFGVFLCGELRNIYPRQVAGFPLHGAF